MIQVYIYSRQVLKPIIIKWIFTIIIRPTWISTNLWIFTGLYMDIYKFLFKRQYFYEKYPDLYVNVTLAHMYAQSYARVHMLPASITFIVTIYWCTQCIHEMTRNTSTIWVRERERQRDKYWRSGCVADWKSICGLSMEYSCSCVWDVYNVQLIRPVWRHVTCHTS